MPRRARNDPSSASNGANLGFEQKLWAAADALRGSMDAAKYKHVVLGLIFFKHISDTFEAKHEALDSFARTSFTRMHGSREEPHACSTHRDTGQDLMATVCA